MNCARVLFIAIVLAFSSQLGSAQDLARYRVYVLESSLESVAAASGTRAADAKMLHERPAKIQELEWRAPYSSAAHGQADPVQRAVFAFYDGALYQVVVSYDRGRTDGLGNSDIIESLTAVYGTPVVASARSRPPAAFLGTVVLAQWDSPGSSLTLLRSAYSAEFQLVLVSKALSTRAQSAIREAGRLDTLEAPRRELEERNKELADAADARDKLRTTNKAAFRP
jgi:hypothetical protein